MLEATEEDLGQIIELLEQFVDCVSLGWFVLLIYFEQTLDEFWLARK